MKKWVMLGMLTAAVTLMLSSPVMANQTLRGENEVWYDYAAEQWAIGNPKPKDYGINWTVTDLDGDGRITSADYYLFELPRENMIKTLKARPEYEQVLSFYQGGGVTTDLSGLWLTRPPETIGLDEYLGALGTNEAIRLERMQLDKLFADKTIVINENERKKLDRRYDELGTCRRILENSTILNYTKMHGTDIKFDVFDQAYYDTIKNNTAKWVMLYGSLEQKAVEPAYKPAEMPDAPESVQPTNSVQEAMRRQLTSCNE